MRRAPQEIAVSGHVVRLYMLPPFFSMVLDDAGVVWVNHPLHAWIAAT